MIPLTIMIRADGKWPDLIERIESGAAVWHRSGEEAKLTIATLSAGTSAGRPSVAIRIDTSDGKTLIVETTARLFIMAADAIRAAHEGEL